MLLFSPIHEPFLRWNGVKLWTKQTPGGVQNNNATTKHPTLAKETHYLNFMGWTCQCKGMEMINPSVPECAGLSICTGGYCLSHWRKVRRIVPFCTSCTKTKPKYRRHLVPVMRIQPSITKIQPILIASNNSLKPNCSEKNKKQHQNINQWPKMITKTIFGRHGV